jgi:hypothetical protein
MRRKGTRAPVRSEIIKASKGLFCRRTAGAVVLAVSVPRRTSRNWGYQREAQCGYRAVEVITRHAFTAGSAGSALGDSMVVQQDPRAGVKVHSDCTSQ